MYCDTSPGINRHSVLKPVRPTVWSPLLLRDVSWRDKGPGQQCNITAYLCKDEKILYPWSHVLTSSECTSQDLCRACITSAVDGFRVYAVPVPRICPGGCPCSPCRSPDARGRPMHARHLHMASLGVGVKDCGWGQGKRTRDRDLKRRGIYS